MRQATEAAEKVGIGLGVKFVRGVYMLSARKLAHSSGHESPMHDNIHKTHACYDDCASYMLGMSADGFGAVILAMHNVESTKLAATKARDLRMMVWKGRWDVEFAQLYGDGRVLIVRLTNSGFTVSKYRPFERMDMVIPYLLRRAEEN